MSYRRCAGCGAPGRRRDTCPVCLDRAAREAAQPIRLLLVHGGSGGDSTLLGRYATTDEAQAAAQAHEVLEWHAPNGAYAGHSAVGHRGVYLIEQC